MRRIVIALLALGGMCPVAMAAGAEIRLAEAPPVTLAEPLPGAEVAAGTSAYLAWQPLDGFGELGELDEWEAFLSLDGGATYPLRITPQLDLDLRRVLWRVPDLLSDDARILLHLGGRRTGGRSGGGERFEVAVELPHRLRIVEGSSPVSAVSRWTLDRGQAALPGEPGVVSWVEGSRRAEGLTTVATIAHRADLTGYEAIDFFDLAALVETGPASPGAPGVLPAGNAPPEPSLARAESRRRRPPASREILLQTSRLNE